MKNNVGIIILPGNESIKIDAASYEYISVIYLLSNNSEAPVSLSVPQHVKVIPVAISENNLLAKINECLYQLVSQEHFIFILPSGSHVINACVPQLLNCMQKDPFYAFAIPRTNQFGSAPLPNVNVNSDDEANALIKLTSLLPERSAEGIVTKPPVLIHPQMFQHFSYLDETKGSLTWALAKLFITSNRAGYRAVIANQSLVMLAQNEFTIKPIDIDHLKEIPDLLRELERQASIKKPEALFEQLMKSLIDSGHKRVLFDLRNLAAGFNGTVLHVLSLVWFIDEYAAQYNIEPVYWVTEKAEAFHQLKGKLRHSCFVQIDGNEKYAAAIRLAQPWSFSEMHELSRLAPVIAFNMLDSIGWDCYYIRMGHIDGLWRATARLTDGLIFNSAFTKNRFLERFPAANKSNYVINRCSLDPNDYINKKVANLQPAEDYILLVGNEYYHKALDVTIDALATCFPEMKFKVLGKVFQTYPNVEIFESGYLDNDTVDALYQQAKCLVFPSYYEGFGLPIMFSLAYGKPVIIRKSELADELNSLYKGSGSILQFEDLQELVEIVHQYIVQKKTINYTTQKDNSKIWNWKTASIELLAYINKLIDDAPNTRCMERLTYFYEMGQMELEKENWRNPEPGVLGANRSGSL